MLHKILLSIHHESGLHHLSPWAYLREERHLDITLGQRVDLLGFLFVCFLLLQEFVFLKQEPITKPRNYRTQVMMVPGVDTITSPLRTCGHAGYLVSPLLTHVMVLYISLFLN